METAKELEQYVLDHRMKGCECPTCKQRAQLYKFKMPGPGVCDLIRLYRLTGGKIGEFRHVDYFENKKSRSFCKLRFWGFIIKKSNTDSKKKDSGKWAMTQAGKDFVENNRVALSHALLYNGKCEGFTGKETSVKEAIGHKFDYQELMTGIKST